MSLGRKAVIWSLYSLFVVLVLTLAADICLLRIVGQPKSVENILDRSGVYNTIVPGLLEEAKTVSSANGDVPLSDPIVKSAVISTLTPQFLRTNTNQALDGIYLWLDGKVEQPKFAIKLDDVKSQIADKVAAGAKQKAAALPVCTSLPTSTSVDVFSATCLPRGVAPDQVAAQVHSSIITGQGFLDNTTIQASDLKSGDSNQPVFDNQLKNLPQVYRDFKKSPFGLVLLTILVALSVIFIYQPRLMGLRNTGFILVGSGLLVMMIGFGISEGISNKVIPNVTLTNSVFQSSLRNVLHDLASSLRGSYMIVGAVYMLLGAVMVGSVFYLQRKQPAEVELDKTKRAVGKTTAKQK